MTLPRYRLLSQIGVGPDGLAYRGEDIADGRAVEIRVLTRARDDPQRWSGLVRRLRLAALLDHPGAVRVLELEPDADPPRVVLPWAEPGSFVRHFRDRRPLTPDAAAGALLPVAEALVTAHRFGLTHEALGPEALRVCETGAVSVDFTDARVHPPDPADADLEQACRPPEAADGKGGFAGDVFALAAVWTWLRNGAPLPHGATPALDPDPANRPTAAELAGVLRGEAVSLATTSAVDFLPADATAGFILPPAPAGDSAARERMRDKLRSAGPVGGASLLDSRERIGRYRLLGKIGQGGMGAVYRAEDPADGSTVAVKVLNPLGERLTAAVQRFRKEARLLAEVANPYVTRLLEVNEDDGLLFLVMEFVPGRDLGGILADRKRLDERTALAVMADVARALADAHRRGIVHRDIKPENVLVIEDAGGPRAKLTDFGLARRINETPSQQLTQTGAVLGTPLYMAPEQCSGKPTDPRTDVYAMGATLFHLLAGRPPFVADSALGVMAQHRDTPAPPLRQFNGEVSDAACLVVETALAKAPDRRYPDAESLFAELDRLLRGEPARVVAHPWIPEAEPGRVQEYVFTWELVSPPAKLWPHVANTERLNRAIGLPAVEFTAKPEGDRVRRFARARKAGMVLEWEEFPFEWVEGRRFGVFRDFSRGPFKWFASAVDLTPRADGGTTLTHRITLEPRGAVGRALFRLDVNLKTRKALERVYRRIDATAAADSALADPFVEPAPLSGVRRRRLDRLVDAVIARGVDAGVARAVGEFLARAPDQEVARIRPLALAERLGLPGPRVVEACLHGAREGLLVLLWDLLCPVCRIPSEVKESLRQLQDHGRCDACQIDYTLDFDRSVEMIFRAHPEVRNAEVRTYCIGGPAHSPHVAAQVRLGPGERFAADLALADGAYRVRGPQLPYNLDFRVRPGAPASGWDLKLAGAARMRGGADRPPDLRPGQQRLMLTNDYSQEVVVRVERTAPRGDALTAARAMALALFRDLFPQEVLAPGRLVRVSTAALLTTDLDAAADLYRRLGDARAFAVVHEHFRILDGCVREHGGTVVKTVGDGILAAFSDPADAVSAALELQPALAKHEPTRELRVRVGVHRGPVLAATVNDQPDYFGAAVKAVAGLPPLAAGGGVVVTDAVALDPVVAERLARHGVAGEVVPGDRGPDGGWVQRLRPAVS